MPYSMNQEVLNGSSVTLGASETNTPVSNNIKLSDEDSMLFNVDITTASTSLTTGITVKIQDSSDGGTTWNTKKSATVTATAEVQTITFDTKANTGDGDYVVITDVNGQAWAVAADTTGASANTPTGAVWTAIGASFKTEADISGATTAAQVAAAFETAFDGLTGFSAVVTSDDTAADGTMTMTSVISGPDMAAGQVYSKIDEAPSGVLAVATTTAPVATGVFTIKLMPDNGTDSSGDRAYLPLRPLARVVATTGAGDAVTVSSVRVSKRRSR